VIPFDLEDGRSSSDRILRAVVAGVVVTAALAISLTALTGGRWRLDDADCVTATAALGSREDLDIKRLRSINQDCRRSLG
jgi:hypothetical protein